MQKVIVLFGKNGSGKGTRLGEYLNQTERKFKIISVGDTLREARAMQTELGKKAASYMDAGELVPDDIINGIVFESLKNSEDPVVCDGFPRTVAQAQFMLDAGIIPVVIHCDVNDDIVIQRSSVRIVCEKCRETYTTDGFKSPSVEGVCDKCGGHLIRRSDDAPEVVKNRLEVYKKDTLPALDLFKNYGVTVYTIDNSKAETARKEFAEIMDQF